ncbi:archease [Mycobacterium simiae]|uniref:Archease n=1 Tax=Mycobacterium simiae TaxID=1784 RepID=A0A5B1BV79_MYCSI|nr:archease [Mycobacterium simiae]KAA1251370.1 archease [Mycobacterium simiae]
MADNAAGHRSVPHTADLRIEAWAPTREGCIRQAVLGAVESFLDTGSAKSTEAPQTRRRRITADTDADLLVAALEEVIYLLDTTGEAPADVRLSAADGSVEMTLAMVDASTVAQLGAVPKAVSLNDLQLAHGDPGWRCSVTLDV